MFNDRGNGYGMHDGAGAGFWLMAVMMLILVVAVLALLYLLATRTGGMGGMGGRAGRDRDTDAPPGSAHRLLDERFARGEMDEDEYRRRRAVLHGD